MNAVLRVKEVMFVLNVLIFTSFSVHHFCIKSISECSILQTLAELMTRNIFKSSAKGRNSEKLILARRSLAKIMNNKGPKVEPCGTPDSMGKGEKDFPKS
jgi:hypothetical protein